MTGRWTRNRDEVLVYLADGKRLLGSVYAVGLGTYPRPWKAVVYYTSPDSPRKAIGMFKGTSEAKRAIEEFWSEVKSASFLPVQ